LKQFIGSHSRRKSERATRANSIVAHATVHLKKIADKSQHVGKRISRNCVMQQKSCGDAARDSLLRIALFC